MSFEFITIGDLHFGKISQSYNLEEDLIYKQIDKVYNYAIEHNIKHSIKHKVTLVKTQTIRTRKKIRDQIMVTYLSPVEPMF